MIERPQHLRERDQFSSRFGLRDVAREAGLGHLSPGREGHTTPTGKWLKTLRVHKVPEFAGSWFAAQEPRLLNLCF